jgi:hypothetical protein
MPPPGGSETQPPLPTAAVTLHQNQAQTNSSGNIAVAAEFTEHPTVKMNKNQRRSKKLRKLVVTNIRTINTRFCSRMLPRQPFWLDSPFGSIHRFPMSIEAL